MTYDAEPLARSISPSEPLAAAMLVWSVLAIAIGFVLLMRLYRVSFFVALWLTLNRLARCNPWGGSGYDPVPPARPRKTNP